MVYVASRGYRRLLPRFADLHGTVSMPRRGFLPEHVLRKCIELDVAYRRGHKKLNTRKRTMMTRCRDSSFINVSLFVLRIGQLFSVR